MYGPQSYTFRAYRLQHLIDKFESKTNFSKLTSFLETKADRESKQHQFQGWECVSLKFERRTLDLVIHDSNSIMNLILAINVIKYLSSKGLLSRDLKIEKQYIHSTNTLIETKLEPSIEKNLVDSLIHKINLSKI